MALGKVNRNEKWRFNDLVFTKTCSICGITVEWQADTPEKNTANNFHTHLYKSGWSLRGLFVKQWVCDQH